MLQAYTSFRFETVMEFYVLSRDLYPKSLDKPHVKIADSLWSASLFKVGARQYKSID